MALVTLPDTCWKSRAVSVLPGSSLRWLVVVIPLTDYTMAHGPLMVAPGKHTATTVLPSENGRVHPIAVGVVPVRRHTLSESAAEGVTLRDTVPPTRIR